MKLETPKIFVFPGVSELIKYDADNITEFARTLRTYLHFYINITATTQALHIHRNTLAYRLKKCEELADFNLSNEEQCKHVHISLDILLSQN